MKQNSLIVILISFAQCHAVPLFHVRSFFSENLVKVRHTLIKLDGQEYCLEEGYFTQTKQISPVILPPDLTGCKPYP